MMIPYSPSLALTLAEHAAAVYYLPHQFARWALDQGHDGSMVIEREDTQIGIAYGPKAIIVTPRGSESFGDALEDVLAFRFRWPEVFPVGRVHVGFRRQAKRVAVELQEIIRHLRGQARYQDATVYIAGHSLGGALAPFLAHLLSLCGVEPEAIYTFESPRIGNKTFASWCDATYGPKTFRVVCIRRGCADIVTRFPPSAFGWWHIGRPILLRDGRVFESPQQWERARHHHPVTPLSQWRIVSRLAVAVQAHAALDLVEELRGLAR